MGRYCLVNENNKPIPDVGFNSKSEAESWIQDKIEESGLDWRAGGLVRFKNGTQVEVVSSKTGESIKWSNVKPLDKAKLLQNNFGFVDGKTLCSDCGEVLTRDDCCWAFGRWWHKSKSTCDKIKK